MMAGPYEFGMELEKMEKALEDIAGLMASYYVSLLSKDLPKDVAKSLVVAYQNSIMGEAMKGVRRD